MKSIKLLPLLACMILLFSCKKEEIEDSCKTDAELIFCNDLYEPVCGCDNITYDNDCHARAEGVASWSSGKCQ